MNGIRLYEGYSYESFRAVYEVWTRRISSDSCWVVDLERMYDALRMQHDPAVRHLYHEIAVADD